MLPTGLYVLGSRAGARCNLMTISWVSQMATRPRLVGVGLERDSVSLSLVSTGRAFALSLLAVEDRGVVRRFVRPVTADEVDLDRGGVGTIRHEQVVAAPSGVPVLSRAVAMVDCRVDRIVDLGSHSWVIGEVTDARFGAGAGPGPDAGDGPDAGSSPGVAGGDETGAVAVPTVLSMGDTRMHYGG